MIVGIVGSEAAKFTYEGMVAARSIIRGIIAPDDVTEVVSGGCHLGGIDEWAAEIGEEMGRKVTIFSPKVRSWEAGYKPRNILIARQSDIVHCITVDVLPTTYRGMTFKLCYHCGTTSHIKSGGCWTAKQAQKMGKRAEWHVVGQIIVPLGM